MSPPASVLIVDDDPAIQRLLRTSLRAQGFATVEAGTGAEALALGIGASAEALAGGIGAKGAAPDVILLDLGLPDMDGLEVIRAIRAASAVPIVVLSARETEHAKVAALDLGADDYVTKPFGMAELSARLRTALRHRLAEAGAKPVFRSGALSVDLVRRTVTVAGAATHLSPREYDILALLVLSAGRVLTHRMILGKLWGASADVQQLRVYIRQLRQKIEPDPERPTHLLTETGIGYRLAVDE